MSTIGRRRFLTNAGNGALGLSIGTTLTLLLTAAATQAQAAGPPLKVCLISGSWEYESQKSLPIFKTHLESQYNVRCTLLQATKRDNLPGLEALNDCDVALFFTRRLDIDGDQLDRIKKYCQSGRPIVAVRTASHGFQKWLAFDKEILGGNYHGHYGTGPTQKISTHTSPKNRPVLDGVPDVKSRYSLYKTAPVADDCTILQTGSITKPNVRQPVTWTRIHNKGRVFYTALGGVEDFENSTFRRMLTNALFWAADRKVERHPLPTPPQPQTPTGTVTLKLRSRKETQKGNGIWQETRLTKQLPIAETAVLICDMWDEHWCRGATERCKALAQKMNPVLEAARDKGIQIIHCPSETLYFYADWPQRLRIQLAPRVEPPKPLNIPSHKLPIDDSDGGCDTGEKPWYSAWTRQSPYIDIGPYDVISDDGKEVYNFIHQQGIKNIIYTGVHTNMCVLGRSFGIRQMTRWSIDCFLVRDLTDAMYDPNDSPNVSHDEGTELVVQHIEKYWCPSTTSAEFLQGLP